VKHDLLFADVKKSPRVDTPPLNHIGLWVDNLEEAVKWMTGLGVLGAFARAQRVTM
jgi:hypothetical protein